MHSTKNMFTRQVGAARRSVRQPLGIPVRLCTTLAVALVICLGPSAPAAPPVWWTTRGVVSTNASVTNDFAAVNVGQIKWIARQAKAELDANIPGGCGSAISNLVATFTNASAHDYASANVGQVKNLATPFYDCLRSNNWPCVLPAGMTTNQFYPWSAITNRLRDFAVVNLGQVKYIFSFSSFGSINTDVNGFVNLDVWTPQE